MAGAAYLLYQNWDQVKAYFAGAWAEIKAGFNGGITGILSVLANFSPIGLIYQAFSDVLNYLGVELPARFTDFGGMIVNGLVNGLTAGLGAVKDTISSLGESTIGWFKEKLGIHSPSRVFAELGGFTTEGLAQGLSEGAKQPLDAVGKMGQALTQAGAFTLKAVAPELDAAIPAIPQPPAALLATPQVSRPPVALPAIPEPTTRPVSPPGLELTGLGKALVSTLAGISLQLVPHAGMAAVSLPPQPPVATVSAGAQTLGTPVPLTVDSRPPIAAAGPMTYDSHDVYHINIPTSPGMDAQAIARAVGAELDRRDREKLARHRSRLTDSE